MKTLIIEIIDLISDIATPLFPQRNDILDKRGRAFKNHLTHYRFTQLVLAHNVESHLSILEWKNQLTYFRSLR